MNRSHGLPEGARVPALSADGLVDRRAVAGVSERARPLQAQADDTSEISLEFKYRNR